MQAFFLTICRGESFNSLCKRQSKEASLQDLRKQNTNQNKTNKKQQEFAAAGSHKTHTLAHSQRKSPNCDGVADRLLQRRKSDSSLYLSLCATQSIPKTLNPKPTSTI